MPSGLSNNVVSASEVSASTKSSRLSLALAEAHSAFTIRNPKSSTAYEESLPNLPGSNTRTVLHTAPFPLVLASGRSCFLTSIDGDTYIDFLGEYTAGIYGHSCEPIKQAIKDALDKGWNLGGPTLFEKELAALIVKRFENSVELVRFCNSGTEANLMAVGAAVNFTGRKKILVFTNAYHGSVFAFPNPLPKDNMNVPHDFVLAPYNDIPGTTSILATLPPSSLAVILVEPLQGAGCIPGDLAFLSYLRSTTISLGALLIFDEVMTSRLGYGGYQTHPDINIKPDLTTLGKWIGGGMSFGAFGGRRDIMGMFDPRAGRGNLSHSGTFNNNVVSMAAGVVGCGILTREVIGELNRKGEVLRKGLELLIEILFGNEIPKISVSGVGSLMTVAFKGLDKDRLQSLFYHHMLARDIYLAGRGFVALSIEIKETHIEKFIMAVEEFVIKWREVLL